MATKKISNSDGISEEEKITIEFDNGDLNALTEIEKEWNFSSKENALRFALAVLFQANDHVVYVKDENGNKKPLTPGDNLLKPQENNEPPNS